MQINKVYNEDCLDTMDCMPDGFIDLTVTSPPYDKLRVYEGFTFDVNEVAKSLYRVTKTGGVVVWVINDATVNGSESGTSFKHALIFMAAGFNLHDTMIFRKGNPLPMKHNRYNQCFEYMFVFSKGKPKTFNPIKVPVLRAGKKHTIRERLPTEPKTGIHKGSAGRTIIFNNEKVADNIFTYGIGNKQTLHPAPFPEKLAEDHIATWSNEGDIVYDCCAGSGTTLKMAAKLKRNWVASEISAKYCDVIETRLQTLN